MDSIKQEKIEEIDRLYKLRDKLADKGKLDLESEQQITREVIVHFHLADVLWCKRCIWVGRAAVRF